MRNFLLTALKRVRTLHPNEYILTQRDNMQMDIQSFLDRLSELAGAEVAEQLQREYGGSEVYVPLPSREQETAK